MNLEPRIAQGQDMTQTSNKVGFQPLTIPTNGTTLLPALQSIVLTDLCYTLQLINNLDLAENLCATSVMLRNF